MQDKLIFDLIENETNRQINTINLIASENYVSKEVMRAQGSCLTNKYAEGMPYNRYYGGCENIDIIEQICIERAKKLFKVKYVNVQPHSGSQANAAVMFAVLNKNENILGLDLKHGGHLTHGSPKNFSGKFYNSFFYKINVDNGCIDYNDLKTKALTFKPKLIICGGSSYVRDWDYQFIRKVADEIGAIVMADISHIAGFIICNLLNNPIPHCHIITSTTHKTLRGPKGGIIMMQNDFLNPWNIKDRNKNIIMMSTLINNAVFPGIQGGPFEHIIAAKAVSFLEASSKSYFNYINQVKINAKVLSKNLLENNYKVISGGTDNHIILIDLSNKNVDGITAEKSLEKAGIIVNKNVIPYDSKSPQITSGIRIGTSAVTTRNMKETEMIQIGFFINNVINNYNNLNIILETKNKIVNWIKKFPIC